MDTPENGKNIEIKGHKYKITGLGTEKQILLLSQLTGLIGVPVGVFIDVAMGSVSGPGGESLDIDMGKIARGIAYGVGDGQRNLDLAKSILSTTRLIGGGTEKTLDDKALFDEHFDRRIGALMELIKEVLVYQFEDFFGPGGIVSKYTEKLIAYFKSPAVQEIIKSQQQALRSITGDGTYGDQS